MRITESYLRNVIRTTLKGVLKEAITETETPKQKLEDIINDLNTGVIEPLINLDNQIPKKLKQTHTNLLNKLRQLKLNFRKLVEDPTNQQIINKTNLMLNEDIINFFHDNFALNISGNAFYNDNKAFIDQLKQIEGNLGLISTQFRTFQSNK